MPQLTSPINKAMVLRGVTPAVFPMLNGKVVHEREELVRLRVPGAVPVKVSLRVVRSNSNSLLNLEYRLTATDGDYDGAIRMGLSFFGAAAVITFADFRFDGPGVLPPNYFESTAEEVAAFRFDYGLSMGRDSRWCTISTTAREYNDKGGTLKLTTGRTSVTVDVPAPVGSGIFKPMPMRVEEEAEVPVEAESETREAS